MLDIDTIFEHYQRSEVKQTILRYSQCTEGFRALNGDTGWYVTCSDGSVRLRTPEDYDETSRKFRTLYATLDLLDESVKHVSKKWDDKKKKPVEPIGTFRDCLAFSLSADIDSIKGSTGENITNSQEIRKAVEDAGQFFVDYLRDHGITKSVHCLYSGGGIYVHLHHSLFHASRDWSPEERDAAFRSLTKSFNALIGEIEKSFFETHPEHRGRVKFDQMNNQKRKFKCIYSIHKKYDLAVIPLDPANIKINIDQAQLPLNDKIIEVGESWYQSYDPTELSKLKDLFKPFMECQSSPGKSEEHDSLTEKSDEHEGFIEINTIFSHDPPLSIEDFPPCMKNIVHNVETGRGPHRALAILASYLHTAGWTRDKAFELWKEIADRVEVESRIFEVWYGELICPNCEKIQKTSAGYPNVGLGGQGYCEPDEGCKGCTWPGNYERVITLDAAKLLVAELKEKTKTDPGLPFDPKYLEALAVVKVQDRAEFERIKAALKNNGISIGSLMKNIKTKITELNVRHASIKRHEGNEESSERLTVELTSDLLQNVNRTLDALNKTNDPPVIFQRGGTLCRIRSLADNRFKIEDLSDYGLLTEISRSAKIVETSSKGNSKERTPPKDLALEILALPGWDFPVLNGLVNAPVVRPDGSLLLEPGYDATTGLYYNPDPTLVMPTMRTNPTIIEGKQAADHFIEEVLIDFPFIGRSSLANIMAMFLTPIVRPMIRGCVPLGLISKPSPGTGASKLFELVSIISTGRPMKAQTAPNDEEEWRKKITSLLRGGSSIITFDNVDSDLESGMLASALTSHVWEDRVLGRSDSIDYPQRASWFANGNNLTLKGDLGRRSYLVQIDAEVAHPWERKTTEFRHPDLEKWVLEHRGELLVSLLTMVRAWVLVGKPGCDKIMGGFEEWTQILGGILNCSGVTGFLGNDDLLHAEIDAGVDEWTEFISAWYNKYKNRVLSSSDLINGLEDGSMRQCVPTEIAEKIKFNSPGNAIKLTHALRKKLNVHFPGGFMLKQNRDSHSKMMGWQVVEVRDSQICAEAEA